MSPPVPLHRLGQAARGLALRALLPLMVRRRPLPELLGSLDRPAGPPGPDPALLADRLFRPLRFWPTTCLYRALGSYALQRAAGHPVRFVIGVRTVDGRLQAHAWLERDGRAMGRGADDGRPFTVAYAWPADPAMLRHGRGSAGVTGIDRSDDAVLTELQDGTGVLLHLRTRYYFTLNPTGVQAWKLLGDGARDAGELAQRLAAAFPGADPAGVRADVDALLADLAREELVTIRD